ncbi:MAG TPA: N-acetylmuramoyl-L-alanine amidase [Gemmatimonadaceae bacterium]|nr:N-acetylmuramoyl-L-alanine amidase [Gemmatimonadaceae bacterium]
MPRPTRALLLGAALVACARAPAPAPSSPPLPRPTDAPALPAVPRVEGPLAIRVVYPPANAPIASRDSNFVFGSVGHGAARLTIDGAPVPVAPNGAFLAFLPLPTRGTSAYDLVAVVGADTARLQHPVRLPPPRPMLADTGRLVVDTASVTPRAPLMLRDDEAVRVAVRAPANAAVWVSAENGVRQALVNAATPPLSRLVPREGTPADSAPRRFRSDSLTWATDVPARLLRGATALTVARGGDTVRFVLPRVESASLEPPLWGMLVPDTSTASDSDRVVFGRPTPGGTYKWFFLPGTVTEVTGRRDAFARVRLDQALEAWVNESDVRLLAPYTPRPRRVARNARLVPAPGWVDLVIPMAERPAHAVEEQGRALVLTLYGTQSEMDIITYQQNDSLVRTVEWAQEASDRVRVTLHLATAPYGYLVLWQDGAFVVRVRRPPAVDPRAPLRGLTIAVDPGHPPIGATGPTGLYEGDAVLPVGLEVRRLLERRGARVTMTRVTRDPVPLADRPVIARRADAHALVSIHLNAFPDGVNPFPNVGTGVYFFHAHSEPLARAVQRGLVAHMGLRNLGVYYDNLMLARPTWMPAVLCEGAFLMVPEQEAALRTPEFQRAYAVGIVEGLEAYFRALGRE